MILKGKSRKGMNRVRENGDTWELCGITHHVQFSDKTGPWGLVKAIQTGSTRWVHMKSDDDFEIVKQ